MNGSIHVDSEFQKGSTFSIRFPFEKNENTYVSTTSNIKLSLPEISILIAEDDEINFLFLEEMLSEYPIHILHARNGEEALKIFLDHKDNIDLILMDIQMPLMDGFQATAEIRKYNKEVPIIAQTAYAYSKEIELSKSVGCNDYIVKPIQQEELLTKIKEYVKTKT
jgi:CheY-like chemotaxis protein